MKNYNIVHVGFKELNWEFNIQLICWFNKWLKGFFQLHLQFFIYIFWISDTLKGNFSRQITFLSMFPMLVGNALNLKMFIKWFWRAEMSIAWNLMIIFIHTYRIVLLVHESVQLLVSIFWVCNHVHHFEPSPWLFAALQPLFVKKCSADRVSHFAPQENSIFLSTDSYLQLFQISQHILYKKLFLEFKYKMNRHIA